MIPVWAIAAFFLLGMAATGVAQLVAPPSNSSSPGYDSSSNVLGYVIAIGICGIPGLFCAWKVFRNYSLSNERAHYHCYICGFNWVPGSEAPVYPAAGNPGPGSPNPELLRMGTDKLRQDELAAAAYYAQQQHNRDS